MANSNVQVAASQLQRAATDIKNNIWAIQRDYHDMQARLRKEIDDLTRDHNNNELLLTQLGSSDQQTQRVNTQRRIGDIRKQLDQKKQELAQCERDALAVVRDKESAAAELASKASELAQKAMDPKFAM